MDHFSVESKNNIDLTNTEYDIRGFDGLHQPHLGEERLDPKDRAHIHDGTSKDDVDRWSDEDPSADAFGEEELERILKDDIYEDDEGYKVEERPDSEEDDFDDEDRS